MLKKPNILIIQVDELAPHFLPCYGNMVAITPNLDVLAGRSLVFQNAYCNYPLCSPSRASMHAGRLPFAIQQWDNGAEFHADIPTFAHYLRQAGYSTSLCGKMHFIGPDQYHGYEERLTTDIYPSDFSWTPDWRSPVRKGGGVRVQNVVDAGTSIRNMQQDYDEEVGFNAVRKVFDLARNPGDRPFLLTASFTQPHPPFVAPQKYWDLYEDVEIDAPRVPPIAYEDLNSFDQARHLSHGAHLYDLDKTRTQTSRRAYYAMISYIDDLVGDVLTALKETGLDDDTLIVFTSDHGEMLGERGMWLKDCFYDPAVRVPLLFVGDMVNPAQSGAIVSLVDLMPTLLDIAGVELPVTTGQDGSSLVPFFTGSDPNWKDEAISEYAGSGYPAPSRMVRKGRYKYWLIHGLQPELYDLEADPQELDNMAGRSDMAETQSLLHARLMRDWDPEAVAMACRESQASRLMLRDLSEKVPKYDSWSLEIRDGDKERYVRGRAASFGRKAAQRFPKTTSAPYDHLPDDDSLIP